MHNTFFLKEKYSLVHTLFAYKDASKHLHTRTMKTLDYYCRKNYCGYRSVLGSYFTVTLYSKVIVFARRSQ